MELKITRLDTELDMPGYAHEGDAAFDLRAAADGMIPAGEKGIIKTGLKMAIPLGFAGLIWDRSGLAAKQSMHVLAGVIDSGYRGEVGVVMKNLGKEDFEYKKNDRVAQMLIQPVATPEIIETEELDSTTRNEGGFGSTGVR